MWIFFFSSRRRHTRLQGDWSSDVCSSDLCKTRKDPGTPEICNIFTLHQGFSPPDTVAEVAQQCRTAGWGCLDCKRVLADNMIKTLAPMRERAAELKREPTRVLDRLRDCANRARALGQRTMA